MIVRPSVIIVKDNRVLLMKYNYNGQEVYGLPGGNPDDADTLQSTVVRELKEELNLDIQVGNLMLVGEVIFPERKKSTLHCVFWGEITGGAPGLNPEHTSAQEYVWMDINKIESVNMYPNIGKNIRDLVIQGRPSGTVYTGQIKQQWF
ncbi:MAG: NUDIX domain-containing protein [Eubacteriales bacterium]